MLMRRLTALFLSLLLTCSLAACGEKAPSVDPPAASSSAAVSAAVTAQPIP